MLAKWPKFSHERHFFTAGRAFLEFLNPIISSIWWDETRYFTLIRLFSGKYSINLSKYIDLMGKHDFLTRGLKQGENRLVRKSGKKCCVFGLF
jgi:hypothetical protein